MAKTNDATGATAAGMTGIVEHAAPLADGRVLSELDPEKNLDGTLIEGEHPDHAGAVRRDTYGLVVSEPVPIDEDVRTEEQARAQPVDAPVEEDEEEESSPGISLPASMPKTGSTRGKSNTTRR